MADTKDNEITQTDRDTEVVTVEPIQYDIPSLIYVVRGQQVMMDSDLAALYQVETRTLNQTVKHNITRYTKTAG